MNVIPATTAFECPCCHGFIGEAAPTDDVAQTITSSQKLVIFKALAKKPGRVLSVEFLENQIWGSDPNGGPDASRNAVYIMVHRLNKHIARYGWHIASQGRGSAGGYRLIPTEAGQ